ncbi:hypothetical protein BCV70DRAFT_237621 [Testicularia cyperi]|uniref:Stealth protein CR1 conserved region 1 domain-containing protein n=1 Tax=Testicularia cyperi TaxID=1882483 RepID=A0A317XQW6_9BASI|nr:hypothetical protein BCV70DRAFT_237621 [Testicularia cyperi]
MLRYLRPITEPFSNRYGRYLPLPTSTPRGSVSSQGSSSSDSDGPGSPMSSGGGGGGSSSWSEKYYGSAGRRGSIRAHVRSILHHSPPLKTLLLLLLCFVLGHVVTNRVLGGWSGTGSSLVGGSSSSTAAGFGSSIFLISEDKQHRIFADRNPGAASRQVMPIKAYEAFSDACVEEWIVHGVWGQACKGTDLSQGTKIDGVWAWVNGSDPAQIASRHAYRPSTSLNMDAAHRYADHNELLYSMRSALDSWGPKAMAKMHIMASAYPLNDAGLEEDQTAKLSGQIPIWLSKDPNIVAIGDMETNLTSDISLTTATTTKSGKVVLHHDAEYFKPMNRHGSPSFTTQQVREWRKQTIPSFNSLAVESQLFNLEHNDADQLVYFNDDFFTLAPNSVSDVTSPLYGPVLKSDTRMISFYWPSEKPFQRLWNPAGEEVGIKRAGWILGQRFPMRTLPYITHHPRSLWLPLLKEAAQTFPDSFSDTTLARFRAQKEVPTSVQGFFLASWYIVERHREALLWSWVVAKWGGVKETIDPQTKAAMWAELVNDPNDPETKFAPSSLDVYQPIRASPDDKAAFEAAGVEPPKNTQYSFSSRDGHGLSYLDWTWFWQRPRHGFPDLTHGGRSSDTATRSASDQNSRPHARSWTANKRSATPHACSISRSKCMDPARTESASDFFKRIAFAKPECGDCMVAALIGASGSRGLEKFMPPSHATISVPVGLENVGSRAHLPLTNNWRETDFALSSIFSSSSSSSDEDEVDIDSIAESQGQETMRKTLSLRTWCARLVQRYQYVLGSTPSTFYKVEKASKLPGQLQAVENTLATESPTTYLCLNDDIKEDAKGTQKINSILKDWFQSHWPAKLPDEV